MLEVGVGAQVSGASAVAFWGDASSSGEFFGVFASFLISPFVRAVVEPYFSVELLSASEAGDLLSYQMGEAAEAAEVAEATEHLGVPVLYQVNLQQLPFPAPLPPLLRSRSGSRPEPAAFFLPPGGAAPAPPPPSFFLYTPAPPAVFS